MSPNDYGISRLNGRIQVTLPVSGPRLDAKGSGVLRLALDTSGVSTGFERVMRKRGPNLVLFDGKVSPDHADKTDDELRGIIRRSIATAKGLSEAEKAREHGNNNKPRTHRVFGPHRAAGSIAPAH